MEVGKAKGAAEARREAETKIATCVRRVAEAEGKLLSMSAEMENGKKSAEATYSAGIILAEDAADKLAKMLARMEENETQLVRDIALPRNVSFQAYAECSRHECPALHIT